MPTAATPDGRELHHTREGSGEPTVVFESGMGASGLCWAAVQHQVAARTSAVAYDRSGFGRSPTDPAARTLPRLAADLGALLDHLGAGPFVLVGHSWGGPIVRTVAAAAPDRVAGLVLVDPTDETCPLYTDRRAMRTQRRLMTLLPLLAGTGLLRLGMRRTAKHLPEPARLELPRVDGSTAAARAMRAEFAHVDAGIVALRAAPPELPNVPVTIISGVRPGGVGKKNRSALTAAHEASAARLPQGRHVLAERSGHLVPLSQPDLVATEVLQIV